MRLEDVHVTTGDTRRMAYAVGTFASRAAVMSGNAIALAARNVRAKALRIAADALEVSADDLEIVDGVGAGQGRPGHVDAARAPCRCCPTRCATPSTRPPRPPRSSPAPSTPTSRRSPTTRSPASRARDFYSPTQATFANGMHAAIVETDPVTAEITILRYCVIHDCGTMINPMIVEGQVHGGVAQGVGGALYERMAYDESGQLLNASFMDFLMPYASEVPHIETDHLETPSPLNPLGIKGAGEAGLHPRLGRHRLGHRGRRGLPDHLACRSPPSSCGSCASATRPASIPSLRRAPPAPHPRTPRRPTRSRPHEDLRTASLAAPPEQVWDAFHDPAVLARCLPGCETLTEVGPAPVRDDHHRRRRRHQGHLRRRGAPAPSSSTPRSFTLKATGAGAPGHGRRRRRGPPVAQRAAAAPTSPTTPTRRSAASSAASASACSPASRKKMAGQFFAAVDARHRRCPQGRAGAPAAPAVPVGVEAVPGAPAAPPVYAGAPAPGRRCGRCSTRASPLGVGLGAVIALIGVVVGAVLGEASLMRAFTAAAVQIAPVPGSCSPGGRAQEPRQVRRLHAPLRGRHGRRARRAARDGDDRLHPRLLHRGAVGPRLRAAGPGHRADPGRRPGARRVRLRRHLRARPGARRRLQQLGARSTAPARCSGSTARRTRSAASTCSTAAG